MAINAWWPPCGRGTANAAQWQTDLTKEQLPAPDAPAEKDGLLPADIAVLPSTDPSAEPQFVLLWGPASAEGEQRRMIVDLTRERTHRRS